MMTTSHGSPVNQSPSTSGPSHDDHLTSWFPSKPPRDNQPGRRSTPRTPRSVHFTPRFPSKPSRDDKSRRRTTRKPLPGSYPACGGRTVSPAIQPAITNLAGAPPLERPLTTSSSQRFPSDPSRFNQPGRHSISQMSRDDQLPRCFPDAVMATETATAVPPANLASAAPYTAKPATFATCAKRSDVHSTVVPK